MSCSTLVKTRFCEVKWALLIPTDYRHDAGLIFGWVRNLGYANQDSIVCSHEEELVNIVKEWWQY